MEDKSMKVYCIENKTVTRINASGTNIGRLAKAFGKNAIDEIISIFVK